MAMELTKLSQGITADSSILDSFDSFSSGHLDRALPAVGRNRYDLLHPINRSILNGFGNMGSLQTICSG